MLTHGPPAPDPGRRIGRTRRQSTAMPTRRRVLAAPLGLAASTLPARPLAAVAAETPAMPDLAHWDRVRAQFELDPSLMHFASFYIASHPAPVRAAIDGYRRAIDRNPYLAVEHGMFSPEQDNLPLRVQREVAAYIGARPEEIALTGNTTTGLALVYQGLRLKAGDEILVTEHDHCSHHESVRPRPRERPKRMPCAPRPCRTTRVPRDYRALILRFASEAITQSLGSPAPSEIELGERCNVVTRSQWYSTSMVA